MVQQINHHGLLMVGHMLIQAFGQLNGRSQVGGHVPVKKLGLKSFARVEFKQRGVVDNTSNWARFFSSIKQRFNFTGLLKISLNHHAVHTQCFNLSRGVTGLCQ